ncbi:carboxylesterase/lipase family protein [Aspergillus brunneoviolaceus CBS 621.78]|uniref:Carboxylesterase n=1 Tax=Aspergillus brunneoviolaceus CBS 621.78 TaxID=1450534 RepID=A0ACD1G2W9_9EURO|nr:putative carboxylesterase [Aspergillus brunneoviolaceus CBS 621.78]RAH43577.1 putative carboxylesterase [Aspergillus brunneoviolaceus CBS 621.78]
MPSFATKGLASLALGASFVHAQLWDEVIQTSYGPVQGFQYFNQSTLEKYFGVSESNVTAFLGVPFAADTGYENRWKAPQPRTPWNETLQATAFGPACPSQYATDISEDCLSLNLWTNAGSASDKLPVMVWNQGSDETSDDAWWYGGGMALKDVILITFNRRDDAFGYLAHPELNEEGLQLTGHNTSGNYGVLDQLEVLKWVRNNIAQFGGDPDRVVVAGQSFGSSQVYHAVNSPLFTGYFHGGISESGIRYPYDPLLAGLATSYVNMSTALFHGVNYTTFHNASSIAELRTLSMEDLLVGSQDRVNSTWIDPITALSAGYPLIFKPVLDGYVLPSTYLETLINGPANDVPVITGNTKDESGASTTTSYTVKQYEAYTKAKYGDLYDEYIRLYPDNGTAATGDRSWNAAARDASLIGSWAYATDWYKAASSDFYTYYWTHAPPGQDQGAFHQSEIMYALNALYANVDTYPFADADWEIQERMSAYWANFAKTLDPNEGGSYTGNSTLPVWRPNSKNGTQVVMELGDAFGDVAIAEKPQVKFMMKWFHEQTPY